MRRWLTILAVTGVIFGADSKYLEPALEAARWIESAGVKTATGTAWANDPRDPKSVNTTLYNGVPGPVLFFLEAWRATGDKKYLADAQGGADYLLASLAGEKETGLYEGLAGLGFVLEETYKATHEERYREGARLCVRMLSSGAKRDATGVTWSDVTDIIGGSAGTGLFLLYAAHEWKDDAARELAIEAGRHLIDVARKETSGLNWAMDSKFPRLMPNFSHGTAGIAYFLATLYQDTHQKEFLDAALAGARYLQSIANTEGEQCLIYHDEPDNKNLYYLGWCHGPPGTARLFYRLYEITKDKTWLDWTKRSARSLLKSGIPERQTPGFWNNVSWCCGSVSVAQFSLAMYRVTKDREYLDFSRRVTTDLLQRATHEEDRVKWVQAEHRVQPNLLIAQTGLAQGAAGIGLWLLELNAFESGKKATSIRFPDAPF